MIVAIVNLIGVSLIAWIVWFFFISEPPTEAAVEIDGIQEVRVVVQGGYQPNLIEVASAKPVRLIFLRQESSACSMKVVFPDLQRSALLPENEEVIINLGTLSPGTYSFSCEMNMLHGKLVVREE